MPDKLGQFEAACDWCMTNHATVTFFKIPQTGTPYVSVWASEIGNVDRHTFIEAVAEAERQLKARRARR
jgi:hypothetical protein